MATADSGPAGQPEPPGTRGAELFSQQAKLYAAYRPDYPEELYAAVLQFAALPHLGTALDVACGTGQVAAALSARFDRVWACDSTQAQLDRAVQRPNLRYFRAAAERLEGVGACTVDLLTAAQCLHWFDGPAFYAEARRVLQPGYGMPRFASVPGRPPLPPAALGRLQRALQELHTSVLGPYWDPQRWHVLNHYRGTEPGAEHFGVVQRQELAMHKDLGTDALLGYLATWSAYATYRRQQLEAPDPLQAFRQALLAALEEGRQAVTSQLAAGAAHAGAGGGSSSSSSAAAAGAAPQAQGAAVSAGGGGGGSDEDAPAVRVEWPLFLILAKQPVPLPAAG
ncbi:SAM-dependent methyltransferase [Chlorella sorokiniana]|uniref:SAM-dependent methyltransferase n=1 Tax=Chlorella sorokiniana TaxID=3076 RepID=A0A2P6TER2_CHLSO|nr:SAM-dependent methyltransferase [Chlorella sorokiniana]|eukprot:PRW21122.1 SAM-dependent methyltransferase [Chlorella sorokiniana]